MTSLAALQAQNRRLQADNAALRDQIPSTKDRDLSAPKLPSSPMSSGAVRQVLAVLSPKNSGNSSSQNSSGKIDWKAKYEALLIEHERMKAEHEIDREGWRKYKRYWKKMQKSLKGPQSPRAAQPTTSSAVPQVSSHPSPAPAPAVSTKVAAVSPKAAFNDPRSDSHESETLQESTRPRWTPLINDDVALEDNPFLDQSDNAPPHVPSSQTVYEDDEEVQPEPSKTADPDTIKASRILVPETQYPEELPVKAPVFQPSVRPKEKPAQSTARKVSTQSTRAISSTTHTPTGWISVAPASTATRKKKSTLSQSVTKKPEKSSTAEPTLLQRMFKLTGTGEPDQAKTTPAHPPALLRPTPEPESPPQLSSPQASTSRDPIKSKYLPTYPELGRPPSPPKNWRAILEDMDAAQSSKKKGKRKREEAQEQDQAQNESESPKRKSKKKRRKIDPEAEEKEEEKEPREPSPEIYPGENLLREIRRKRNAEIAANPLKYKGKGAYARNLPKEGEETFNQRFAINPEANQGLSHQFNDVVRNKAERKTMHGTGCDCCQGYYEQAAMEHGAKGGARAEMIEEYQDKVSRHRHHWEPPKSPPEYWGMTVPSTAKIAEINETARRRNEEKMRKTEQQAKNGNGRYVMRK